MTHEKTDILESAKVYTQIDLRKSIGNVITSLPLYLISFAITVFLFDVSLLLYSIGLIITALFLLRTFVVFHGFGHESLFNSPHTNHLLGHIFSIFFLTPYFPWRRDHNHHHGHSGDLDATQIGGTMMLTKKEYQQAGFWLRFYYRLQRNPAVMLLLGPLWMFFILYRIPRPYRSLRENINIILYDLLLIGFVLVCIVFQWYVILMTYFVTVYITSLIGIFFFYTQHNYEQTYWRHGNNWKFVDASINGASFWDLNPVMRWFTVNIGFHHAHHLMPSIPNYNLEQFHRDHADQFKDVYRMTFPAAIKSFQLKLWDEENKKLISFRELYEEERQGDTDLWG